MDKPTKCQVDSTIEDTVCDFGSVKSCTKTVYWRWTVTDCSTWPRNTFDVSSPTFTSDSLEWCMVLTNTQESSLYLIFDVKSPDKSPMVKARLKVDMISEKGNKYAMKAATDFSVDKPQRYTIVCLNNFFSKEDGIKDMFKLVGEVSIIRVVATAHVRPATRSVAVDLGSLLDSGELSDLVLRAGDSQLRAHRQVLAARSPVFAAMLRHDSQEARTGVVDIPDVDPEALQQLLQYVYTGAVLPAAGGKAAQLMVAADKYDLPGLKFWCEQHLASHLDVDNAAATAVFALAHNCDLLKKSVVSFAKGNIYRVLGSDGWGNAVAEHPEQIRELCRLLADMTS